MKMYAQKITQVAGILLVLGFLLNTPTTVLAQRSDKKEAPDGSVADSIRQLEKERVQALVRGDTAFIERNYADDYLTTSFNGLVRNRPEVIADLKSGAIKYESMTHDDVRLRIFGNTVIVTGLDSVNGVDKGQDITGRRRFTRVWVKQSGRWWLVANHTTRVP